MKNFLENILWYFNYGKEKVNLMPKKWRIAIFFVGLLFVYLFWKMLFMGRLTEKIMARQSQKSQVEMKIRILKTRYIQLNENIKKIEEIKAKEVTLKTQLEQLAKAAGVFDDQSISPDKLTSMAKVMLTNMGLSLDSLQIMPKEPLPEFEFGSEGSGRKLFKKTIVITFRGRYFSVLNYIKELEKLNWQLYWDDLDYKVIKYPEALVELKLHVLSV